MKDFFYGLITVFIILFFYFYIEMDKVDCYESKLAKYNGMVVVNKGEDFLVTTLTVFDDSTRTTFMCDKIIWNRFKVKDTVQALLSN